MTSSHRRVLDRLYREKEAVQRLLDGDTGLRKEYLQQRLEQVEARIEEFLQWREHDNTGGG